MNQTPRPAPVELVETETAIQDSKTRLATFKRGLSECEVNIEKVSYNLQEARLLVTKYKEIYRECLRADLVSLPEVYKLKDVHERNVDMFITYQIELQTLAKYVKDLKHAINQEEGRLKALSIQKGAWNQILPFPCPSPKNPTG